MIAFKATVRNGRIETDEPIDLPEGTELVISQRDDAPSLTAEEAAEIRGKLAAWEGDWNAPGMEAYDDYETRRRSAGSISTQ